MKVKTNLKAGGFVADSVDLAGKAASGVGNFVSNANAAANDAVNAVGGVVSSGLDAVKSKFL